MCFRKTTPEILYENDVQEEIKNATIEIFG